MSTILVMVLLLVATSMESQNKTKDSVVDTVSWVKCKNVAKVESTEKLGLPIPSEMYCK